MRKVLKTIAIVVIIASLESCILGQNQNREYYKYSGITGSGSSMDNNITTCELSWGVLRN